MEGRVIRVKSRPGELQRRRCSAPVATGASSLGRTPYYTPISRQPRKARVFILGQRLLFWATTNLSRERRVLAIRASFEACLTVTYSQSSQVSGSFATAVVLRRVPVAIEERVLRRGFGGRRREGVRSPATKSWGLVRISEGALDCFEFLLPHLPGPLVL